MQHLFKAHNTSSKQGLYDCPSG